MAIYDNILTKREDRVVRDALKILKKRISHAGEDTQLTQSAHVKDYLRLRVGSKEHEVFGAVWLDSRRRVIAVEELFRGTIDRAPAYPREVAKSALRHNAAAVILFHNHPSAAAEPSEEDRLITKRLVAALDLLDIRTFDHIIVGAEDTVSFAEKGYI